jgi:glycosyltransferase involved in cell wall biosynthesis
MAGGNDNEGVVAAGPKVSVVMAVYNGEKYLREAVESILGQTLADLEFIIVDDGSTDRSAEIVNSYGDPRIHFLVNGTNLGLMLSLNRGIDAARGEYIARMDCDDVSLPERLARQVAFMESRPEVVASGTWARDMDEEGRIIGPRQVPVGARMDYDFWRPSPLIHPTAMIRASQLGGTRYDPEAPHAEDYDLWLRLKKRHRIDNLPEYLLLYRVHDESVTRKDTQGQLSWVHTFFCRHTGLAIPFETFLELVGFKREMNPARRALLMRRLARAIRQPYRRFLRGDIEYARGWLVERMAAHVVGLQFLRAVYYLRRRMRIR